MNFIPVQTAAEREALFALRYRIFVEGLGVPVYLERDTDDQIALHILVKDGEEPVAVARMVPRGKRGAQIGRLAVVEHRRGEGIGKLLIRKLENQARRQGHRQLVVDVPMDSIEFYHKLGYRVFGETFDDAGVLHRSMKKRLGDLLVVAVGGNAVVGGYQQVVATARTMIDVLEAGWRLVITHGNGPQVGDVLLRSEIARDKLPLQPLDECVASTQGTLGYDFQRALGQVLAERGLAQRPVTVITQTVVDPQDPAFEKPTKPIGPFMSEEQARAHERDDGWTVREDSGRGWRRMVPSPLPATIMEMEAIKALLENEFLVVAAGGGGIPVTRDREGVQAVIDKDRTAAILATELDADAFLIATAVEKVCLNFGTPEQIDLDKLDPETAGRYIDEGHFAPGSMRPKVQAAVEFAERTRRWSVITHVDKILAATEGHTGTRIEHPAYAATPWSESQRSSSAVE